MNNQLRENPRSYDSLHWRIIALPIFAQKCNITMDLKLFLLMSLLFAPHSMLESVQDCLIKLGMKPCMHLCSGNKYFFTKSCHRQTYQNYEQPPQTSQNSYF